MAKKPFPAASHLIVKGACGSASLCSGSLTASFRAGERETEEKLVQDGKSLRPGVKGHRSPENQLSESAVPRQTRPAMRTAPGGVRGIP
ncbi:unnamed protein product [Pleuronectes platessa]|uniref:Uncharacterized protein n=1 Tax=Pleuronectes platessa TaxID=8262 RepID=A0A9N7W4K7_PLEPL|nr:unnamed protein product [Pleuronectes platessa]